LFGEGGKRGEWKDKKDAELQAVHWSKGQLPDQGFI
jgi:hypothetical protein